MKTVKMRGKLGMGMVEFLMRGSVKGFGGPIEEMYELVRAGRRLRDGKWMREIEEGIREGNERVRELVGERIKGLEGERGERGEEWYKGEVRKVEVEHEVELREIWGKVEEMREREIEWEMGDREYEIVCKAFKERAKEVFLKMEDIAEIMEALGIAPKEEV